MIKIKESKNLNVYRFEDSNMSENAFIKAHYSEYLLELCKNIILSELEKSQTVFTEHDPIFNKKGACFVTLKKNGRLRGCIGSIIAHPPLINDLIQNTINAAFHDPRFNPVQKSEVEELSIDISLLSAPEKINFEDEQDLLSQIVPYKDGIIIQDFNHRAVYLPSVWEELPDKVLFLNSLKKKAGLTPEHFSKTFEAYRFYTVYIEQK